MAIYRYNNNMFRVISTNIYLPDINQPLQLNSVEQRVFNYLKQTSVEIPRLSNGQYQSPVLRVAGGWVRDRLMGRESKDLDITVDSLTGEEFAKYLQMFDQQTQSRAISRINTNEARPEQIKNLAVAFLKIFGQEVEILSLRTQEVYEEGNRNPTSIKQGTPQDDAARRDLTFNSMFYNINTGKIEDFTGRGYSDLQTLTLRTPLEPQKTFQDDPLRLLRVLRFFSRYNGSTIAPEVLEAMKDPNVQHQIVRRILNPNEQHGIVTERTAEEFRKIMTGEQPDAAIRIMYQTGLLQKMLNLPSDFSHFEMDQNNPNHALSVIDHTIEVIKNMNAMSKKHKLSDEERGMMNICSLFHDFGKLDPRALKIKADGTHGYSGRPDDGIAHEQSSGDIFNTFSKALGLTNKEQAFISDVVLGHMDPHSHVTDEGEMKVPMSQLRKFKDTNPRWKFMYLHAMADHLSKGKEMHPESLGGYERNLSTLDQMQLPVLLNGQEIMQITGLKPGVQIGEITRQIRKHQYNNFGKPGELPFEEAKALATEVAKTYRKNLLDGLEIQQYVTNFVGRPIPPRPPPGMEGYISVIQKEIKNAQDINPNMTKDDAIQMIHQMAINGFFQPYQV